MRATLSSPVLFDRLFYTGEGEVSVVKKEIKTTASIRGCIAWAAHGE